MDTRVQWGCAVVRSMMKIGGDRFGFTLAAGYMERGIIGPGVRMSGGTSMALQLLVRWCENVARSLLGQRVLVLAVGVVESGTKLVALRCRS